VKRLIGAILLLASSVYADDPGPLAPCYALISNGWDILRLRNAGVPITIIEQQILLKPVSDEQKDEALAFTREVWQAPGNGWDWILAKHKDCLREIKYHQGEDYGN